MVELVLAKDWARVRFPAPAQSENSEIASLLKDFCAMFC